MTPEETAGRLSALTAAVNSVDQDVQDLQVLRKNDAQIIRTVAKDLGALKAEFAAHREETRAGMSAITAMIQTLIDRDSAS